MTPDECRQRMQVILDQHDQMAREFRESSEALRAQADEQAKYLREQTAHLSPTCAPKRICKPRI